MLVFVSLLLGIIASSSVLVNELSKIDIKTEVSSLFESEQSKSEMVKINIGDEKLNSHYK